MMSEPSLVLSGKTALVTGGNSGIGRAIALVFANAGASIAILGRSKEKNEAVLAELSDAHADSLALEIDISDRLQLNDCVERVEESLGPIDILVNNAGAGAGTGILELESAEWDRVLETNLRAPVFLCQQAARLMSQRAGGKIINIASLAAIVPTSSPAYSASKAGLVQATRSMARELGPHNIQVNAIAPGWIDTQMAQRAKQEPRYSSILAKTAASRFGEATEVADAALYLASPAANFVTGTVLVIDGGLSIGSVT